MTPDKCSVPGCFTTVPGRFHSFCVAHHFGIPREYTRAILRMKIECANTTNDDDRAHLTAQIPAYIRTAISKLPASGSRGAA